MFKELLKIAFYGIGVTFLVIAFFWLLAGIGYGIAALIKLIIS